MKKGIIAISLLLSGALLITPIANAVSQNGGQKNLKPVMVEQATDTEKSEVINNDENKTTQNENINNPVKVETTVAENNVTTNEETTNSTENVVIEDNKDKEEINVGMTKSEAEAILNKYIKDVEQSDFTYTYQGDENTFEAIKEKGIRGYVFLPNLETDMAYLVDKDNGSIYFFHPSGYFELLQ